jgi:hypothetical protein
MSLTLLHQPVLLDISGGLDQAVDAINAALASDPSLCLVELADTVAILDYPVGEFTSPHLQPARQIHVTPLAGLDGLQAEPGWRLLTVRDGFLVWGHPDQVTPVSTDTSGT